MNLQDQSVVPFLLHSLTERGCGGADSIRVVAIPAPLGDALSLWRLEPSADAWLWIAAGANQSEAAVGAPVVLTERDGITDCDLSRGVSVLWSRLRFWIHPDVPDAPAPRLVGGLQFRSGAPPTEEWKGFGRGRFFLPRWRYFRCADRATLTVAMTAAEGGNAEAIEQIMREYHALVALLALPPAESSATGAAAVDSMPKATWIDMVQKAREAIACALLEKVVVARRTHVRAAASIDPVQVLAELSRHQEGVTVFGIRVAGAAFVGATPEILVRRTGDVVQADALAGTAPVQQSDCEDLLESRKDRHEQSLVVRTIAERLSPLCVNLSVPSCPEPHRLRHVVHLRTAIEGHLRVPIHVLELVRLLHPTPAVGGLPSEAALQFIDDTEPVSRGWYAGPLGWFDAEGNGAFVVAIRSGLLRGRDAYCYAGAGIVDGSDPAAEYAETDWKLRAMCSTVTCGALEALG